MAETALRRRFQRFSRGPSVVRQVPEVPKALREAAAWGGEPTSRRTEGCNHIRCPCGTHSGGLRVLILPPFSSGFTRGEGG